MKYLVTAALALALTGAAASALADPPDKHHDHSGGGHPPPAHGSPPPGGSHGGPPGGHGGPPGGVHIIGGGAPPAGGHGGLSAGAHIIGGAGGSPGGHGALPGGGRPGGGHSGSGFGFHSHGLRPGDQGRSYYNPGSFQRQYSAERRFRVFDYAYPGGWYARSWGYGDYLPDGWYAPDYYLDWGYYQLPEPPIGCEWVREGADAVLVDVWTGEVLSVESGVFY